MDGYIAINSYNMKKIVMVYALYIFTVEKMHLTISLQQVETYNYIGRTYSVSDIVKSGE